MEFDGMGSPEDCFTTQYLEHPGAQKLPKDADRHHTYSQVAGLFFAHHASHAA
jgi:hypothetical protein